MRSLQGMTFLFLFLLSFSVSAQRNLYLRSRVPTGNAVSTNVLEAYVEFSHPIIPLNKVGKELDKEHLEKIETNLECKFIYKDIKTVKCLIQKPLELETEYRMKFQRNFASKANSYMVRWDANHNFKTESLAIVESGSEIKDDGVYVNLTLNAEVTGSGNPTLKCSNKETIGERIGSWGDKKFGHTYKFSNPSEKSTIDKEVCTFFFSSSFQTSNGNNVKAKGRVAVSSVKRLQETFTSGSTEITTIYCGSEYNKVDPYQGKNVVDITCKGGTGIVIGFSQEGEIDLSAIQTVPPLKFEVKKSIPSYYDNRSRVYIESEEISSQTEMIQLSIAKQLFSQQKFFGGLEMNIQVVPKPPKLKGRTGVGVLERDLNWYLPMETINVTKFRATVSTVKEADDLGSYLSGKGNAHVVPNYEIETKAPLDVPWSFPLDLKKTLKDVDPEFKNGFVRIQVGEPSFQERSMEGVELLKQTMRYYYFQEDFNLDFKTILITNMGMHIKRGSYNQLVYVYDLKTGKPLKNAEVKVWSDGKVVHEDDTNEFGFVEFGSKENPINHSWKVVTAEKGDDYTFITDDNVWQKGIFDYEFGIKYDVNNIGSAQELADIVSERPLYKPGEKVSFKVFARQFKNDLLQLKSSKEDIRIVIRNSRREVVFDEKAKLNDYGTLVKGFDLKKDAPTGWYSASVGTVSIEKVFQVEEFRKPQFKIVIDPLKKNKDSGYVLRGRAEYHFGGGVGEAEGKAVLLFQSKNFEPQNEKWKKYHFGKYDYYYDYYEGEGNSTESLGRESLNTDGKGYFSHTFFPSPNSDYGTLIAEANFQDENGGTIANRVTLPYSRFDHFTGIKFDRWSYEANTEIEPQITVLDINENLAFDKDVIIDVTREYYETVRRLGTGNYYYYDWNRKTENVEGCRFKFSKSKMTCKIKVKDHGTYRFKVRLASGTAKETEYTTYIYGGDSYYGYRPYNHDRMDIHVSSNKVKKGEIVEVLIMSPFKEAEGFITLERDGILKKEKISIKGNTYLHKIKIDQDWMIPGFYVSAVIFRGRTKDKVEGDVDLGKPAFKIGYSKVEVEHTLKSLNIAVKTSKDEYRPGEELEADIEVLDYQQKGRQSELAVAVVDEALLQLSSIAKKNYDILDSFYVLGGLRVKNYETLVQLIGQRTYGKKGGTPGGGGGNAAEIRKNFKSVAYWNPQVETDSNGRLKIKTKLPDNLTGWKVIVVAVDKEHRFGYGDQSFKVNKKLMIQKALPNFLVEGDELDAKFTVHNRHKSSLNVDLTIESSGLVAEENKKSGKIKSDDSLSFLFKTKAKGKGVSTLVLKADGGDYKDAVQYSLEIIRKRNALYRFADSGVLRDKSTSIPFELGANVIQQKMNIFYTSTVLEGLDEIFKYVLSYPYGCWEQRLTKSYFLAKYKAMESRLLYYRFEETAEKGTAEQAIQDLLDLADKYQTENGGFRYYPGGGDYSVEHLSVYTGFAFQFLLERGFKIEPAVVDKLKSYLKDTLNNKVKTKYSWERHSSYNDKAYLLYILGKLGVKGLDSNLTEVYSNLNQLDLFATSYFMTFLSQQPKYKDEFKKVKERLMSQMEKDSDSISFKPFYDQSDDRWKRYWYSNLRSQCAVLSNLVESKVEEEDIFLFAKTVLEGRKNGRYYNTQENTYCFDALEKYANQYESKRGDAVVTTKLNGNVFKTTDVKADGGRVLLKMDEGTLKPSQKYDVNMSKEGETPVIYHALLEYEENGKGQDKPVVAGFELKKELYKWTAEKSWQKLEGRKLNLKRGDLLKIRLEVSTPKERYTVGLTDPLAGCLEPVNTRLASASQGAIALKTPIHKNEKVDWFDYYYRGRGFEFMDLRLKAAQFFANSLKGDSPYFVEYLTQVIATGKFHMNAPIVEEMYYPDVMGVGVDREITVTE